jgi:hypothetical protein
MRTPWDDEPEESDAEPEPAHWAPLGTYGSGFEADQVRAVLEAEHIPVLVRGTQVGLFGAGFQGPVLGGVHLFVPHTALERARELLG